jgi:hypothetical protein
MHAESIGSGLKPFLTERFGPWTLIASGSLGLPDTRFAVSDVNFANLTAYSAYLLIFPTVKNAASANSMQISEVEFLGASAVPAVPESGPALSLTAATLLGLLALARSSPASGSRLNRA